MSCGSGCRSDFRGPVDNVRALTYTDSAMARDTQKIGRTLAPTQVTELIDSVSAYARQETIEPLKGAARWVAFGTLAAIMLGLSMVFGALAVLRASQDLLGDALGSGWSFVHYMISAVFLAVLVWITFSRIARPSLAKDR